MAGVIAGVIVVARVGTKAKPEGREEEGARGGAEAPPFAQEKAANKAAAC